MTKELAVNRASFRNFPKGGGANDDFFELGGGKLNLVPSPSLIVCWEACGALHAEKVLVSTICAYAGFMKQDIPGYFRHN